MSSWQFNERTIKFLKNPDYGNKFPQFRPRRSQGASRRCPTSTYEAALAFRQDKDVSQIETIVMSVIDRHLEPEQREILSKSDDGLRMYEDLGMDSLTMQRSSCWWSRRFRSHNNEEPSCGLSVTSTYLSAKAKGKSHRSAQNRIEVPLMPHRAFSLSRIRQDRR